MSRQMPLKSQTYNISKVCMYVQLTYTDLNLCLLTPPNRFESAYTIYLRGELVGLGCIIWVEVYRHRSLQPQRLHLVPFRPQLVLLTSQSTPLKLCKTSPSTRQEGWQCMDMCLMTKQICVKSCTYDFQKVQNWSHITYTDLDLCLLTPPNQSMTVYTT